MAGYKRSRLQSQRLAQCLTQFIGLSDWEVDTADGELSLLWPRGKHGYFAEEPHVAPSLSFNVPACGTPVELYTTMCTAIKAPVGPRPATVTLGRLGRLTSSNRVRSGFPLCPAQHLHLHARASFQLIGERVSGIGINLWHRAQVYRTPLQRGGPWHAVVSVYIKSQSARMGAMGVHARPQIIHQELLKPITLRNDHFFGRRSPLLEQTCHSTRTKAVDKRAVQCQALNETALRSETIRKGNVRGSLLRASVANTDGISAQANANLVPGGRDFFTCKAPFALS